MKNNFPKIIYYTDEANDDFAGVNKSKVEIPPDFKFIHKSLLWNILAFIAYRVIMTPFAFLYCKIKFHLRVIDNTTSPVKSQKGCFLYSNHTLLAGDAFIPSIAMFPKKVYVIVSSENISSRITRNFILMNGAIPIPNSAKAFKGFIQAIDKRISQGSCIAIYPEAHIWQYYTGIRSYPSKSFRFAVKNNSPIYISTTTFHKKRFGKTPNVVVYLNGPFYPNTELPVREAEQQLRNIAYNIMCENSKKNTYMPICYKRRDEK